MKIFCLKSKPILLILASCGCLFILLLAVFLRGTHEKKSLESAETTTEADDSKNRSPIIELNDAIITRLLLENLPDDMPFSDLVVHISSDGTVNLECAVGGNSLIEFLEAHRADVPSSVKFIIKLLPDSVPASLKFRLAIDSKTGLLSFTPEEITVNNIELTSTLLPKELEISINKAVNSLLCQKEKKIDSIDLSDGRILITLTEK